MIVTMVVVHDQQQITSARSSSRSSTRRDKSIFILNQINVESNKIITNTSCMLKMKLRYLSVVQQVGAY